MKILHVITSLYTGGAESLVAQLAPLMRDRGHEVEVVSFVGADTPFMRQLKSAGIKVHPFGENCSVYDPRHILRLRKIMKDFDVVHTHNTSPQFFAAIAAYGLKCKLVTTEHNTFNRRRKWLLGRILDRWLYGRYATTICISRKAEDNLREFLGKDYPGICTINNGIDIRKYSEAKPIPGLKKEGEALIAMVAAFRPQKDQDTLIRAMKLLPENYRLILVGEGERKSLCEALAREIGVSDRVDFLGLRTDVPQILKSADIVVMSSHYEGLSLSSVEGMASGRPMIASDVDGLREVVGGAGLLIPEGDDKALADLILSLEKAEKYQEVSQLTQAEAKKYDIQEMVVDYLKRY